jgi:hypothetical protein
MTVLETVALTARHHPYLWMCHDDSRARRFCQGHLLTLTERAGKGLEQAALFAGQVTWKHD